MELRTVRELEERIRTRLSGLEVVFANALLDSMTEVIPVYQAGFFLEEAGYLLQKSQEGCLTPWFMQTKEAALEQRRDNKLDLFSRVTKVNAQRAFWVKNFETIFETEGLFSRDKKRLFDKLDKIRAWNR